MVHTKICSKCGVEKDAAEFNSKAASKDGKRSQCKVCQKKKQYEYEAENKEKILARRRELYRQNIDHKRERGRINQKNYNERNREVVLARRREIKRLHPERARAYRQKNAKILVEKNRIYQMANKERLYKKMKERDSYVASMLKMPKELVTRELIELKRIQLKLHRLIKEKQNG